MQGGETVACKKTRQSLLFSLWKKIARLVSLERMFYKSEGMTLGSGMLPDVHLKILQFGQVLCL